jgi:hypothetical protein
MRENAVLTSASLLAILCFSFHLADDIARGIEPGTLPNLGGVLLFVVWLYATLVLAGRRSGYVLLLVLSLLGSFVPVLHMRGEGVGEIARSSGGFFFVWTLLALGVTALFSAVLAARGLWRLHRGQAR